MGAAAARPPGTWLVRNASALAAELMGRGTKKEWEKWAVDAPSSFSLSLSLPPPLSPGLFAALLFRLEPSYHPRGHRAQDTEIHSSCTSPFAFPLRYHHIRWETTSFFISQAFSWETTQHPSNALFRYGWEAYDSL